MCENAATFYFVFESGAIVDTDEEETEAVYLTAAAAAAAEPVVYTRPGSDRTSVVSEEKRDSSN